MLPTLASRGPRYWLAAGVYAVAAALIIGIPTRVIPNHWFSRMTPTRPEDYVFVAASSVLLGMTLALGRRVAVDPRRSLGSGVATFLAVGCPVCNKLVVALIGVGGALSWFAPAQPVIGAAAVALLAVGLRQRLRALAMVACPAPAASAEDARTGADAVALDA